MTQMNYKKQYSMLICSRKRLGRSPEDEALYHVHHVYPKNMSLARGFDIDNRPSNLALLTAREHYVAHKLLAKIWPNAVGNISAVWFMSNLGSSEFTVSSRAYKTARKLAAANQSKLMRMRADNGELYWQTEESRQRLSDRMLGLSAQGLHQAQIAASEGSLYFQTDLHRLRTAQLNARRASEGLHPANKEAQCQWCGFEGNRLNMFCRHFRYCLDNPDNAGLNRKDIWAKFKNFD